MRREMFRKLRGSVNMREEIKPRTHVSGAEGVLECLDDLLLVSDISQLARAAARGGDRRIRVMIARSRRGRAR